MSGYECFVFFCGCTFSKTCALAWWSESGFMAHSLSQIFPLPSFGLHMPHTTVLASALNCVCVLHGDMDLDEHVHRIARPSLCASLFCFSSPLLVFFSCWHCGQGKKKQPHEPWPPKRDSLFTMHKKQRQTHAHAAYTHPLPQGPLSLFLH